MNFFDKIFKRGNSRTTTDTILTEKVIDISNETHNTMQKLDKLVGMEQFKDMIKIAVGQKNVSNESIPGHYIFSGNPGTGKSEAAKIMGEIFKTVGVLSNGFVVTVSPADLIGAYIGQSASKTRETCEKAIGGILFVDEAYQLADGFNEGFGKREALEALMIFMEEHRNDTCVILSGYENEMHKLSENNPVLTSRISKTIEFPDFTDEELLEIFKLMMKNKGLSADEAFFEKAYEYISNYKKNHPEFFGNARELRVLIEKLEQNKAIRLAEHFANGKVISDEEKRTLLKEDIPG